MLVAYIRAALWVYGLILYPPTLLKDCIRYKHFLVESSRSSISHHLKKKKVLFEFFPCCCIHFISFSCHIKLSKTALKKSGENRHLPCSWSQWKHLEHFPIYCIIRTVSHTQPPLCPLLISVSTLIFLMSSYWFGVWLVLGSLRP